MDLKELQELMDKEKGKVIIVENGKPVMVITPYQEYAKAQEEEPFDGIEEAEPAEELTIDDLPL